TSSGTGSFTIGGFLQPTPTLISGSTSFDFGIANDVVNRGNAGVNFTGQLTPVPEPGTLELFGSGLIAFAGLVRRKLKVGKQARIHYRLRSCRGVPAGDETREFPRTLWRFLWQGSHGTRRNSAINEDCLSGYIAT